MFITRNRFICNDISNINSPLERGCLKLKKESLYDDKKQLEVDSYLFFCPSENAIKFARELISNNVSLKETTSKDAIELYKNYLKSKIIKLNGSPCLYEESIERIVPVFKSMYKGIVKPIIKEEYKKYELHQSNLNDKKQLEVDSYLFFCPSANAIKFARELISNNINIEEISNENALILYKNYLKLKIIQLGESPCLYEESIEGIVPVFRSIYESTIKPTVEGLIDNYVDTLNLLNSTKKRRKKGIVNLTLGY